MILAAIIICAIAVCLVIAYLTYESYAPFSTKLIALPLALITAAFMGYGFVQAMGKPVEAYPATEFVYVHHVVRGDIVLLWVDDEETGDRLYIFPYDRDTAKELGNASQRAGEAGVIVTGEFDQSPDGNEPPRISIEVENPVYTVEDFPKEED